MAARPAGSPPGGRGRSVGGTGADLSAAREAAYQLIKSIRLPGSHFRSDIALAAAEHELAAAEKRLNEGETDEETMQHFRRAEAQVKAARLAREHA